MFKQDFPLLSNESVVYLDTAASAQKPDVVLREMNTFYRTSYANVHRGQCGLASRSTAAYESARETVARFVNAASDEIVFTKGATESINLVASGYAQLLRPGDEVLVCVAEHHANFVPWQQACLSSGALFNVFNVLPTGEIDMNDFREKLSDRTKIVAVAHMSNVLGLINPIRELAALAHQVGAHILVDGAQSIAHVPVDMQDLDCDFFAFSGHKLYGPTGIGVLYGKKSCLENLPPYQFGGDMIRRVTIEETTFANIPTRFEAGTTPFVEAIGLAKAIEYVEAIGMKQIESHEKELARSLMTQLQTVPAMDFVGRSWDKQGLVCFNIAGVHPADIAFALAQDHICVRVGHHCAMPIHQRFGRDISLRVSFGVYNDQDDIDAFMRSLHKSLSLLRGDR